MARWWTEPPAPRWAAWVLIAGGCAFAAVLAALGVAGLVEGGGAGAIIFTFVLASLGISWAVIGYRALQDRVRRPRSLQDHFRKPMASATDVVTDLAALTEEQSDGPDVNGGDDGGDGDWGD